MDFSLVLVIGIEVVLDLRVDESSQDEFLFFFLELYECFSSVFDFLESVELCLRCLLLLLLLWCGVISVIDLSDLRGVVL